MWLGESPPEPLPGQLLAPSPVSTSGHTNLNWPASSSGFRVHQQVQWPSWSDSLNPYQAILQTWLSCAPANAMTQPDLFPGPIHASRVCPGLALATLQNPQQADPQTRQLDVLAGAVAGSCLPPDLAFPCTG